MKGRGTMSEYSIHLLEQLTRSISSELQLLSPEVDDPVDLMRASSSTNLLTSGLSALPVLQRRVG